MEKFYLKSPRPPRPTPVWSSPAVPHSTSPSTVSSPPSGSSNSAVSSPGTKSEPQFFRANELKVKSSKHNTSAGNKQSPVMAPPASTTTTTTSPRLRTQKSQQDFRTLTQKPSNSELRAAAKPQVVQKPTVSPASDSGSTTTASNNTNNNTPPSTNSFTAPTRRVPKTPQNTSNDEAVKMKAQVARLDRKVMDLEISNASLMSVNKYLEKRLRAQSREQSAAYDFDEDEEEEQEIHESENVDEVRELLLSEGQVETAQTLDQKTDIIRDRMSSHIEFLETSQQVETSLFRCLSISDSLIISATDAMSYTVNPDDVRVGGRIADNEDNEGQDDEPQE